MNNKHSVQDTKCECLPKTLLQERRNHIQNVHPEDFTTSITTEMFSPPEIATKPIAWKPLLEAKHRDLSKIQDCRCSREHTEPMESSICNTLEEELYLSPDDEESTSRNGHYFII